MNNNNRLVYTLTSITFFCVLLLSSVFLVLTFVQHAFATTGGRIMDGEKRISLIENEDKSFSLYQIVNGTKTQIAGFSNLTDLIEHWMAPYLGHQVQNQMQQQTQMYKLMQQIQQLTVAIEKLNVNMERISK